MSQAVEYGTSGLTMGLLDLSLVVGPLESNITGLSTYLSNQVTSNPSGWTARRICLQMVVQAVPNGSR